jgi:hypothetical protein
MKRKFFVASWIQVIISKRMALTEIRIYFMRSLYSVQERIAYVSTVRLHVSIRELVDKIWYELDGTSTLYFWISELGNNNVMGTRNYDIGDRVKAFSNCGNHSKPFKLSSITNNCNYRKDSTLKHINDACAGLRITPKGKGRKWKLCVLQYTFHFSNFVYMACIAEPTKRIRQRWQLRD